MNILNHKERFPIGKIISSTVNKNVRDNKWGGFLRRHINTVLYRRVLLVSHIYEKNIVEYILW